MSYVDFGELKARVSIEDAVQLLGLEMKQTGKQLRSPCPVCQSGGDRALCVTPAKSVYYCFAAKTGGDQIALVQHVNDVGAKDAAEFLDGNCTSTRKGTSSRNSTSPEEREERREPSEGFRPLQYLQTEADGLSATELTAETLEHFQAGYAPKGVLRGFLACPLHTFDGVLRGYVGQNLGDDGPALKFPNGVEPEQYLYGMVQVTEELYMFRNPLDVMRAYENGIEGGVCFLTETVNAEQLQMLATLMDEKGIENIELI